MAISTTPLPPMPAHDAPAGREFTLTGARSDCCPSRAYARATLNGVDLLFCGHHWQQHRAALTEITCDWVDETEAVLVKTGTVSDV